MTSPAVRNCSERVSRGGRDAGLLHLGKPAACANAWQVGIGVK